MPISLASARQGRVVYAKSVAQVAWSTFDGVEHYHDVHDSARTAVPHALAMRRKGRQHKDGPRHREHYADHCGVHIWCESGLEELAMLVADRDRTVKCYCAQAIEFIWPIESPRSSHVVDRVDFLHDGHIRLVDVHRRGDPDFMEQAELTRAACETIGWRYEVFSGLPAATAENLLFLAADRHPWVITGRDSLLDAVVEQASNPQTIAQLCRRVDPGAPHIILPIVYHALWHHLLSANLAIPLNTTRTLVWRNRSDKSKAN